MPTIVIHVLNPDGSHYTHRTTDRATALSYLSGEPRERTDRTSAPMTLRQTGALLLMLEAGK